MARSPLFDLYDPYGILQDQADLGILASDDGSFGQRDAQLSDLMPQEQQGGLLRSLASAGSSGLAGLGWLLDTPGAVVRGTLSGGPLKGVSALWETSDDRVTGRELLRQYGMVGSDDNWGNFGGGLAAEVLLDPLTYASLGLNQIVGRGAKTAAGQAAQKAGLLEDFDLYARQAGMGPRQAMRERTARDLLANMTDETARSEALGRFSSNFADDAVESALDAPLAKMNRLSFPGMRDGATDLFGEGVGDMVARAGDRLGEGIKTNPYTGPVARRLDTWFDPDVLGMTDYDRQWEARELVANQRQRARADRRTLIPLQMDAERALNEAGSSLNRPEVSQAIRNYLERGIDAVDPELRSLVELPGVQQLTGFFEGYRDFAPEAASRLGLPLDEFRSRAGTAFVPRQQLAFDVLENPLWPEGAIPPDRRPKPYSRGNKPANLSDNYGRSRRLYTDVVDGTDTLNRLSLDATLQEQLRHSDLPQAAETLREWARQNLGGIDADLYPWVDELDTSAADRMEELQAQLNRRLERAGERTPAIDALQAQIDALAEEAANPGYRYAAPDLPADHPLSRQQQDLAQQLERAQRGGELHRVGEIQRQLDSVNAQIPGTQREVWRTGLYGELADLMRRIDPQHARTGNPLFGQNTFNEIARYATGRGRVEATAESMLDILSRQGNVTRQAADAVEGGVNYKASEALKLLGFTGENAEEVLARRLGVENLDNISFNKKFIDDWSRPMQRGQVSPEINPLLEAADDFTKSFKQLALLWPSRYSRDAYSGAFASAMRNSFNPVDWYAGTQIRRGNYDPLVRPMLGGLIPPRLAGVPEYDELLRTDPEAAIRRFLMDAGEQGLGTSTFSDEAVSGTNAAMKELYPGAARPTWQNLLDKVRNARLVRGWNPLNSDWSPFATRSGSGNRNPLLELGDRAAETTDAGNRYGTYLNQIRQGAAPSEAMRVADLTQVRYSPDAFTDIERDVLKRIFPFYSYTRGIMPLIADELVNQPQGLMGKSIRAITRAGEPSEDNFVPEYLRQSAAIPLPSGLPFVGLDSDSNLQRFLTNIDLPFESVINLFTPGTGGTSFDALSNTVQKTALNILGQSNPLIKGPLESVTNRQFYSGRQLSDLYSMFEQTLGQPGRALEQVAVNLPGGSRVIGTARQLMDDRLDPSEKWSKILVNALTGLKFQDVDQERTRRLAARDMLNQMLSTTPGVRTYENITVPEGVLATMPKEQRDLYLLYKIIQSEAAKRARDKKRQDTALDPLQVLGVLQ